MRIVHLACLATPDGSYGGPTQVALNQVAELRRRGHDATLAAGSRGWRRPPTTLCGADVALFPSRRIVPGTDFAGLAAPGVIRWVTAHRREIDVLHVHLARDLSTLPLARWAIARSIPTVVQTHGMVDRPARRGARVVDVMAMRSVLGNAAVVCSLSDAETRDILEVQPAASIGALPNGVVCDQDEDGTRTGQDVLFLARLHHDKHPLAFARAAHELAAGFPHVRFPIVGPDGGEEPALRAFLAGVGAADRIPLLGGCAPHQVMERMRAARIYVAPSTRESFGMTVVEALSVGTPVIVTDSVHLTDFVRDNGAGLVVDGSPGALVEAIRCLLEDPGRAGEMGAAGRRAVAREFGMGAVGDRLEALYRRAVA